MANRRDVLKTSMDPLPNASDPLRDLFEACKVGDIARVRKLVTPVTVNARDTAGRKSTPLHFAAGTLLVASMLVKSEPIRGFIKNCPYSNWRNLSTKYEDLTSKT
ncbi:unnamed protein product [Diabrotica balteata]|uniref:Uncharacterized protein n=1 Tax=Diabrotica balteata TaxID=107213 RepID=A0A9N9T0M4_DIABA|nr:unnamed protein product [Diabrotica balteata]